MPSHWDAPSRKRGRAGQEQRRRRLSQHPLCAECLKLGRVTPTDEIDHIVPLAMGGTDTDDNVQGLCAQHHAEKTALEDVSHGAAATHPAWLEPSAIPLTILCGPPASGKTTYVQQHAKPDDLVIDLDTIITSLKPDYQHWQQEQDGQLLSRAIRVRNSTLGSLARRTWGAAWFIVAAPSKAERDWWASKLGGKVILLHPGVDECKRRAAARGTPLALQGIDKWERRAKEPWAPTKPRQTIGIDGWPVQ